MLNELCYGQVLCFCNICRLTILAYSSSVAFFAELWGSANAVMVVMVAVCSHQFGYYGCLDVIMGYYV